MVEVGRDGETADGEELESLESLDRVAGDTGGQYSTVVIVIVTVQHYNTTTPLQLHSTKYNSTLVGDPVQ